MMNLDIIVLVASLAAMSGAVFIYNRLVALRQTRNNAYADIDVQLKMRHDLIPNLTEVVKRYASHEKDVFENVTAARSRAMHAQTVNDKIQAETGLGDSLIKLMAVAENYPELKADQNFAAFQNELSDIEKSVAAARRFFNNATSEFNTAIHQFPAVIIAGLFGFKEETFFDLGDGTRTQLDAGTKVTF